MTPTPPISRSPVDQPWSQELTCVLKTLEVDPPTGLNEAQAHQRLLQHGPNRLRETRRKSLWKILLTQFQSIIVFLLAVAASASLLFGNWLEGVAIVTVLFLNAAIGFITELRAVRSMEALRKLGRVTASVRRQGQARRIPAENLVPGDIVLLEGGDIVPADLRLVAASKLQADESALTGESVPVGKSLPPLPADTVISDRANMLFQGTVLTRGSGEGVVVATGMASQLGEISAMIEEAVEEITPLEKRLDRLGRKLVWVTLAIALVMAISGILAGKEWFLMMETAIALAVAAIPEGLPIVATLALARGMWRMAKREALINHLAAVETLGATGVICTDKTGTLTENRLSVVRFALADGDIVVSPNIEPHRDSATPSRRFQRHQRPTAPDRDPLLRVALEIGALCNNASLTPSSAAAPEPSHVGDPLEIALLRAAAGAGILRSDLIVQFPEEREEAFDPDLKMMATFHQLPAGGFRVAVKGAGEAVLSVCTRVLTAHGEAELSEETRHHWLEMNQSMARDGLRVLALATKRTDELKAPPYADLVWIGLVGLLDPPRHDVRESLEQCRRAGVKVVMVTGDQAPTALAVAREVGLVEPNSDPATAVALGRDLPESGQPAAEGEARLRQTTIFARVSPRQKLNLISAYQKAGWVVAMTGDGVNDAPALKKADIGVAMGQRGTDVAREAADMILKNDAFTSIVAAIRHGRVIFDNIRRFVIYLMSCNLSEIMVVGVASIAQMPLPILPLQILFLNLVTDVFPALALGMGEGDPQVMHRAPRDPKESVITKPHWQAIFGYGSVITVSVLTAFGIALQVLHMELRSAVTVSFLVLAFAQLWHVFNMRDPQSSLLHNDVVRNPFVKGALILCVALLLAAVYTPGLNDLLQLTPPGVAGWGLAIGASLVPVAVGQLAKTFKRRSGTH